MGGKRARKTKKLEIPSFFRAKTNQDHENLGFWGKKGGEKMKYPAVGDGNISGKKVGSQSVLSRKWLSQDCSGVFSGGDGLGYFKVEKVKILSGLEAVSNTNSHSKTNLIQKVHGRRGGDSSRGSEAKEKQNTGKRGDALGDCVRGRQASNL